jgi:hypothetical protein
MKGISSLELAARAAHIVDVMQDYLPPPFAAAAGILIGSLGPEIPPTGNNGLSLSRYWPHTIFVQKYGLDDFEAAMQAHYELTKRFSTEGNIRAFLVKYHEQIYSRVSPFSLAELREPYLILVAAGKSLRPHYVKTCRAAVGRLTVLSRGPNVATDFTGMGSPKTAHEG